MKGILNNVGDVMTRLGHTALFKMKKASPELLLAGGIACVIGGTVMACKAVKKADRVLDEGREELSVIQDAMDDSIAREGEGVREECEAIAKRNRAQAKLMTIGRLAGVFAPALALEGAGIAMIFTSHGIMRRRQGVLLAAYNALDAAFRNYRQNVLAEEDGAERDRRYLRGPEPRKRLSEGETQSMMGDVESEALAMAKEWGPLGPYTFIFSRGTSPRYQSHSASNLLLIRNLENMMTDRLRLNGHVFLNEVLRDLGLDEVPWGQLVGWIRNSENGDNYVEMLAIEEETENLMGDDQWDKPIYLTFNCDGLIWDKI